jgi:hypothetical protein
MPNHKHNHHNHHKRSHNHHKNRHKGLVGLQAMVVGTVSGWICQAVLVLVAVQNALLAALSRWRCVMHDSQLDRISTMQRRLVRTTCRLEVLLCNAQCIVARLLASLCQPFNRTRSIASIHTFKFIQHRTIQNRMMKSSGAA